MRRLNVTVPIVWSVVSTLSCGARTGSLGALDVDVATRDGGPTDAPAAPLDAGRRDARPPDRDARDASPACNVDQARVFVTSTLHDGALGGVVGADAECMARASAEGLGGSWRAWLSDSRTPASAHVYAAPGGYALLDGTIIASTFDELVSGSLEHAIDLTELGTPIDDGNTEVWTGIDLRQDGRGDGYCADDDGNDWSSRDRAATFPFVGHSNARDATWSAVYLQFCNRTNVRLYCFEVCE